MKRVRSPLVVVAMLAALASFAAAPGPLRVGEIVAQPGQQASGWLVVKKCVPSLVLYRR